LTETDGLFYFAEFAGFFFFKKIIVFESLLANKIFPTKRKRFLIKIKKNSSKKLVAFFENGFIYSSLI